MFKVAKVETAEQLDAMFEAIKSRELSPVERKREAVIGGLCDILELAGIEIRE